MNRWAIHPWGESSPVTTCKSSDPGERGVVTSWEDLTRKHGRVNTSPDLGWEGSPSESVRASTADTLGQINSGRIGSSSSSLVTRSPPPTFNHSAVPAQAPDISNHSSTAFVAGPVSATPSVHEKIITIMQPLVSPVPKIEISHVNSWDGLVVKDIILPGALNETQ
jgi:hypothetical protein